MTEVHKFIEDLEIKSEYVVAAISGGPDSMYLLDVLQNLNNKYKIVVAHVNHNLRYESEEEAIKLEKYCKNNKLIFEMMKIEEYPNNKFSEEVARKIRYEFFDKIINKYNSDVLFTAHHGDDQIETILMRLTRGSSLKGYAGIETISNDRGYKIARPLLSLTKEEIASYLDNKGIWYSIDKTNSDLKYTRNRFRKNVLPELKKENKNVHNKFNEFNNKLLLADKYIQKQTNIYYKEIVYEKDINITQFNKLDKILKIYILEKYLKNIYKENIGLISNKHIELIINKMSQNKNVVFDFPDNKKVMIEYNNFKIINDVQSKKYEYEFTDYIKLPNDRVISIDNSTKLTNNFVIYLNSSEVKLPFIVRTRKNGDYMNVKNMTGRKKINDIFIDSKIPKTLRDEYPIVTDSTGQIIWIPGIKKSHLDRKKEEKYDIILKYD
jgi:tRNA(Ile)-lysidine synthetase-like protein